MVTVYTPPRSKGQTLHLPLMDMWVDATAALFTYHLGPSNDSLGCTLRDVLVL